MEVEFEKLFSFMLILGSKMERVHGAICTRVLIAALSVIERNGNNLYLLPQETG